ncbi:MAG: helix-turn-helix transcriptional regulator [Synergistaceae bacterium]|nr:helix-turn-helix transcriptional regulator [Synergistaceae bacterium]
MNNVKYPPSYVYDNLDGMFSERMKRNVSLQDVRVATGIAPSTIQAYEQGKGNPGRKTYNKLAVFFNWRVWE